jgi:hypothetical protein
VLRSSQNFMSYITSRRKSKLKEVTICSVLNALCFISAAMRSSEAYPHCEEQVIKLLGQQLVLLLGSSSPN